VPALRSSDLSTLDRDALVTHVEGREARIELLEQENRWLKSQLFGRSSERRVPDATAPEPDPSSPQGWLFNEAEALLASAAAASESVKIPAHERAKRGRKPLAASLPRLEILHDLPDDQKHCPVDGTALQRIGEETSEQLDYVPAQVRVLRHVRPKYACPGCRQHLAIAPAPVTLFPKSFATPALLAHIATTKFVDGVPLHRQEAQFARLDIGLGRGTMAGWMIRLGDHLLRPILNLLEDALRCERVIHCDETRLQVLTSSKSATSDHWMWVRAAGPPGRRVILFDYDASRGGDVPRRLFEGYRGALVTDGYAAYDAVASAYGLVHAGCWAHLRRKVDEAIKAQPSVAGQAKVALAFIRELYAIERELAARDPPIEERRAARHARSRPVVEQFHAWLTALEPEVLPESRLGKAVRYALAQWPKLVVFLEHPDVPLDNNRCENAIRPFVIGRRGWLFSDTVPGARASATLYSLVETAKANGLEPHAYLATVFDRLPHLTTVEEYEALLPWNIRAAQASSSRRDEARQTVVG
jgi:transposase